MKSVRKVPYSMRALPRIEAWSPLTFGEPTRSATRGRMTFLTSESTTPAKAAPMAMPIARSTSDPPKAKALRS